MKITFEWLKDHLNTNFNEEKLLKQLTNIGLEVESVENLSKGLDLFKVAKIIKTEKHPNADRLSICEVDNGYETLQVICGAPVIHEGGHYPFAGVGIELPNGMKLKKAKIRGEFSNGMLCSEKELGLGADEGGIMLLAESTSPGQALDEVLEGREIIFDVEITPNRGDCMSHYGVARELSNYFDLKINDTTTFYAEMNYSTFEQRGGIAESGTFGNDELRSPYGITFYKHKETPGLGGEVSKKWFQENFIGKEIYKDNILYSVKVAKAGYADKENLYEVDGISGATITSNGVSDFLKRDLKRYEKYFMRKLNEQ